MPEEFSLHQRLTADTIAVGDLALCRVLLMNDANYPWLILVPRRPHIREVFELSVGEQGLLWGEVTDVGEKLMQAFDGHKLNIAALGNQVPQLHVHVIVRQETDPAWPGPVWGAVPAEAYPEDAAEQRCDELREMFGLQAR